MPNRRKRILLVSVLLAVAVGLVVILFPRNEPKYEGRYLSEWMQVFAMRDKNPDEFQAAQKAVKTIGTNGLPMFVAWISVDTPAWKTSLRRKLPGRIAQNQSIANWLGRKDDERAALGMLGISILGPNAAGAIPALQHLLQTRSNKGAAAINALTFIGGESIPVMQAAFSDPQQPYRRTILWSLRSLAFSGHANECMLIIIAALEDQDARVRSKATNLLQVTTYKELIKLPPE